MKNFFQPERRREFHELVLAGVLMLLLMAAILGGAISAVLVWPVSCNRLPRNAGQDPGASLICSMTLSSEKLAASWRGGYSLNVARNCATYACAGTSI